MEYLQLKFSVIKTTLQVLSPLSNGKLTTLCPTLLQTSGCAAPSLSLMEQPSCVWLERRW